jgi:hypothetical protein
MSNSTPQHPCGTIQTNQTDPGVEGAGSIAAAFDPVKRDESADRANRASPDPKINRSRETSAWSIGVWHAADPTIQRVRKPAWQANLRTRDRANSLLLRAGSTGGPTGFGFPEQFHGDQFLRGDTRVTWRFSRIRISIKKLMNSKHL